MCEMFCATSWKVTEPKVDQGAVEASRHGIARSSKWPKVERDFLKQNPKCAACEKPGAPVQVHHRFPFHYCVALGRPDLELDPRNLITLCETEKDKPGENHHLLVGHLDDFKSSNIDVERDARRLCGKTSVEIRTDARWQRAEASKLKSLDLMTKKDKADFVLKMNNLFPKLSNGYK